MSSSSACRRLPVGLVVLLLALLTLAPRLSRSQTPYPGINWVYPPVVTRGETAEVEIEATGPLDTARAVIVEGPGVEATVLPPRPGEKRATSRTRVRLEVAPDAPLGIRELRLATARAITTIARVLVAGAPRVLEREPNDRPEQATPLQFPSVLTGRIQTEVDTDWFAFEGRRGEWVAFEVVAARLQETIHKLGRFTPHFDPLLVLVGPDGREAAVADDHFFADSLLAVELPADGRYRIGIREATYKGHPGYTYAVIARRGSYTRAAFPPAAPPGRSVAVELLGEGMPPGARASLLLAEDALPGEVERVTLTAETGTQAFAYAVASPEPEIVTEPGDAPDTVEGAPALSPGSTFCGRLDPAGDADAVTFEAAAGDRFAFRVFARRLFSPLDPVLEILDASGKKIAQADDSRDEAGRPQKDPELEWTAPSGGRFVARLFDLNGGGGPYAVYALSVRKARGDFRLTVDPDRAMIGPGNRTAVFVRAHRREGFTGPVELSVEGLPPGLTAHCGRIPEGATDTVVVFSASPDAPPLLAAPRIAGRAVLSDGTRLERSAFPLAEVYQAQRVPARLFGVAVTEESDIRVETQVEEVDIPPGGRVEIPVRVERGKSYRSGSVTLWADWRFGNRVFGSALPKGVTVDAARSAAALNGTQAEGRIVLQAAPNARPAGPVTTVILGLVPIEFSVFVPYSTPPIRLSVGGGSAPAAKGAAQAERGREPPKRGG